MQYLCLNGSQIIEKSKLLTEGSTEALQKAERESGHWEEDSPRCPSAPSTTYLKIKISQNQKNQIYPNLLNSKCLYLQIIHTERSINNGDTKKKKKGKSEC